MNEIQYRIHKFKYWLKRNERLVSSIALIGGFIIDNITLQRIDLLFENVVLFSYLVIAGVAIVLINLYHVGKINGKYAEWVRIISLIAMQFAFGGAFSGFLIFYTRSASIGASWFFLLVLFGLFLANELMKGYFARISFQINLFFIALFSFAIYYVPIVVKRMGALVFILSGVISLALIYAYIRFLRKIIPDLINEHKKRLFMSIGAIFVIINVFYFLNLIPPIPLSMKDAGIYHYAGKQGDQYVTLDETRKWWEVEFLYETIHLVPGESAYALTSIFAPTDLNTKIVHEWLYFDEDAKRWISTGKISFPIVGGRDGGYRLFSEKTNVFPGFWRLDVETPRGQIIGRVKFNVEEVSSTPELQSEIR